jgi:RNA polymerase sigma-70 factor (ECF subfamily)
MGRLTPRPAEDVERVVDTYGDMLFRICLVLLGDTNDVEDAIQETLLKYMQKSPDFASGDHEKAWLITVATNQCRDMLRFRARHPQVHMERMQDLSPAPSASGILDALMTLPEKFRVVLLLHYVEEYRVEDIAKMIGKTPSAVKMRLQKGRKLLEEKYRKEYL